MEHMLNAHIVFGKLSKSHKKVVLNDKEIKNQEKT